MPIQWLVTLASLDSAWFDTNVTLLHCQLKRFCDFLIFLPHVLLQILPQLLPKALVTAKFAGLSIPTKKFDPQKDLGLGRIQQLWNSMVFPYLSNRQDAKKPDFLARNPTGKASLNSTNQIFDEQQMWLAHVAGAIPWDWQRLHFYIQCCGKAQHSADCHARLQGKRGRLDIVTWSWLFILRLLLCKYHRRTFPGSHKLWTYGGTPWDPKILSDALRYVARCRSDLALYGSNFSEEGDIDEWLEFSLHEADSWVTRKQWRGYGRMQWK